MTVTATWQNDAEPVRVELGSVGPISIDEATGYPVVKSGMGEEPNPKPGPQLKKKMVDGDDYPVTTSP